MGMTDEELNALVEKKLLERKAEIVQALKNHFRVEDTHDRLFTEGHRHRGNPDLCLAPLFLAADLDAAILGSSFFGDIHPGQRFNAGGDG